MTTDGADHQAQHLQGLALHEQAVRLVRADPQLVQPLFASPDGAIVLRV